MEILMIVSAHQPAYLPWLGYFHKIAISDVFVIMDNVQFEKNSFTNRNKIICGNKELILTIPVSIKGHTEKIIAQTEVSDIYWRKKHVKSIEQAYRKSPHFETVFGLLMPVLEQEYHYLIDYTNRLTKIFLDYLEIKTKILFASDLNITSQKLDYVIELTRKAGGGEGKGDIFIFGALGKDYADIEYLNQKGIIPYFQNYCHPVYTQNTKEFIPCMSILDLMFNESKEKLTDIIMCGNITKEKLTEISV